MHARIQKVLSEGSNFDNVFFFAVDEGREDPSTTIIGPSSTCQRKAIKWRFPGVPMMVNIKCWLGSFVILRDPDQYC